MPKGKTKGEDLTAIFALCIFGARPSREEARRGCRWLDDCSVRHQSARNELDPTSSNS